MSRLAARVGLALAVFLWSAGGGAQTSPSQRRAESLEKELAIGKDLAAQIERQFPMLDDPEAGAYVTQLGERLARVAATAAPVTVQVTGSQEPYGIVLPGGFLYLSAGLITTMETEAELAGVMAHAVAHIAARHWMRRAARSQGPDSVISIVLLGGVGGVCLRLGSGSVVPETHGRFARAFEDEADWMALEYLHHTRYDPRGLASGLLRLPAARSYGTAPPAGFQERLDDLLRGTPECVVSSSAFDQVKARLKAALRRPGAPPSLRRP